MSDYLLKLKNKFGYSDELLDLLSKLIPNLIIYYGEDYRDIIFNCLLDCEIHIQDKDEDPKNYLEDYFGVSMNWEIITLANAFFHNEIKYKDNKVISKKIIYLMTTLMGKYIPFDLNNDESVKTLIHEICHLIKGYGKLKLESGKIIDSTGLMKKIYSFDLSGDVVLEKEEMVGIEETLNDDDTLNIFKMMMGREVKPAYRLAYPFILQLLGYNDIAKVISISQKRGDDTWIKYIGEDGSRLLIDNFDVLVKDMIPKFHDFEHMNEEFDAWNKKIERAKALLNEFIINYCPRDDDFLIAVNGEKKRL